MARYLASGVLDQSFGTGGLIVTPITGTQQRAEATGVVVQPDGKLAVAGTVYGAGGSDVAVARYNAEGTLDGSFDGDGKVAIDFDGGDDSATAVALDADNSIVVGGSAMLGARNVFAALRLTNSGELATDFGTGGKASVDFGGDAVAADLLIYGRNAVVLAGQVEGAALRGAAANGDEPMSQLALARLDEEGLLDTTFDDDGRLFDTITEDDVISGVALTPDGEIVVAGSGAEGAFVVARYKGDGTPDDTFDKDGKLTMPLGSPDTAANDLLILPNSRIMVAGQRGGQMALVRFYPDGTPDNTFDGDGRLFLDIAPPATETAHSLLRTRDGRLLAGGGTALAQLFVDGTLDAGGRQLAAPVPVSLPEPKVAAAKRAGVNSAAVATLAQSDGKVVSVGQLQHEIGSTDLVLTRHTPDGQLDPAFGEGGKARLTIGGFTCLEDATFSGERLLVGGSAFNEDNTTFALGAYTTGEPRALGFAPPQATLSEADDAATLTVRLSQTAAQTVTAQYAATGGTATNGTDYMLAAGTLTFAPGQAVQHIVVPLTNDSVDELDETVVIALSNPSNASLGSAASSTLTIADDDAAPPPTPGPPPTPRKNVFLPLVRR